MGLGACLIGRCNRSQIQKCHVRLHSRSRGPLVSLVHTCPPHPEVHGERQAGTVSVVAGFGLFWYLDLAKVPCLYVGMKGLSWPSTGTGQGPTSVVSTNLRSQVAWHPSSYPLFFSRRHQAQHTKAVLVTLSSVVQVTCDPPSSHHRPQLPPYPHTLGRTHLPSGH